MWPCKTVAQPHSKLRKCYKRLSICIKDLCTGIKQVLLSLGLRFPKSLQRYYTVLGKMPALLSQVNVVIMMYIFPLKGIMCVHAQLLSHVQLFATPWIVAL